MSLDREQYRRDGYIVCPSLLSPELLKRAADFTQRGGDRVIDAARRDYYIRAVATSLEITDIICYLYDGKLPIPFQTLNFRVGTGQPAHSDTIHFNTSPPGGVVGAWLALEDVQSDAGPFVVYPGTHVWPEYTMQDFGLPATTAAYPQYEAAIGKLIEERNPERKELLLKRGEVAITAGNLLHGGCIVSNTSRTRLSLLVHYFIGGADFYYTPMLSDSEAGKFHLRDLEQQKLAWVHDFDPQAPVQRQ